MLDVLDPVPNRSLRQPDSVLGENVDLIGQTSYPNSHC
jgi:hypothetical protein